MNKIKLAPLKGTAGSTLEFKGIGECIGAGSLRVVDACRLPSGLDTLPLEPIRAVTEAQLPDVIDAIAGFPSDACRLFPDRATTEAANHEYHS